MNSKLSLKLRTQAIILIPVLFLELCCLWDWIGSLVTCFQLGFQWLVSHNCPADSVELDIFEKPGASFLVVKCGFRSPRDLIPQLSIKTICTKRCVLGLCRCSSMLLHLSSWGWFKILGYSIILWSKCPIPVLSFSEDESSDKSFFSWGFGAHNKINHYRCSINYSHRSNSK